VLHRFEVSGQVRVDSGVESGSVVSSHYDPMLAKIIGYGAGRGEAVRKVVSALRRARIHGLTTNRDLLLDILKNRDFEVGDTHTGFLDQHEFPGAAAPDELAVLAAALATAAANRDRAPVLRSLPAGWRNVRSQARVARFEEAEVVYDPPPAGVRVIEVVQTADALHTTGSDESLAAPYRTIPDGSTAVPYRVVLERGDVRHAFEVSSHADGRVYVDGAEGGVALTPVPRLPEPVEHVAPGSLLAPMPGSVLRVEVRQGERVAKGQPVLVLEAMKMEHLIAAPAAGVVAEVHVEKGQQVDAGAVLAIIQEGDS
jgi:propionyl-CoA carboxylase alpha chain